MFPSPSKTPCSSTRSAGPQSAAAHVRRHLDEAVFAALSRLAAIGRRSSAVCLSFSCRDTREFRDTFPSWILLQAFRLKQGDASLTYETWRRVSASPRLPCRRHRPPR